MTFEVWISKSLSESALPNFRSCTGFNADKSFPHITRLIHGNSRKSESDPDDKLWMCQYIGKMVLWGNYCKADVLRVMACFELFQKFFIQSFTRHLNVCTKPEIRDIQIFLRHWIDIQASCKQILFIYEFITHDNSSYHAWWMKIYLIFSQLE